MSTIAVWSGPGSVAAQGPVRARTVSVTERAPFDAFVAGHPSGSILQAWAWGDLRARQHWKAVRLLAVGPDGRPRAAASVLCRELPIGGSILYVPRGPVVDFRDAPALDAMVGALRRLGQRERAVLCKIDPYVTPPDPAVHRALRHHGFVVGHRRGHFEGLQPRHNVIVPLHGGAEAVLARCHNKTRYNIRLAGKRGVEVRRTGLDDLPKFHHLLMVTCARNGFAERELAYFQQVWTALAPGGHIELYLATFEGAVVAAAILFLFGDKAIYAYGASANEHREVMAPYALQWAMIQRAIERGCRTYDMTGVPKDLKEGDPAYGLWRFKRGFWPEVTTFQGEMDLPLQPALYRLWNIAEPAYFGSQVMVRRALRALRPGSAPDDRAEG